MALKIKLDTDMGESRTLYVRALCAEQLKNHPEGGRDQIRFRGWINKEAYEARKAFVWEMVLECDIDVSKPAWPQAYEALKAYDPTLHVVPLMDKPVEPDAHAYPDDEDYRAAKVDFDRDMQALELDRARFESEMAVATKLLKALKKAKDC